MFGEYKKEKWDEAKVVADSTHNEAMDAGTGTYASGHFKSWPQEHYDRLNDDAVEAKKRLDALTKKGHTEANRLNEEYDRLTLKVQESLEALVKFQEEKLGMHGHESSSLPNEL
jgi:hypothetical protein